MALYCNIDEMRSQLIIPGAVLPDMVCKSPAYLSILTTG